MTDLRDLFHDAGAARSPRIEKAVHGRAVIESVSETGVLRDGNPEVELVMTIELPGRDPYPAAHRQVVSRRVLHNLRPGLAVSVTADADDPRRVEIG